MREDAEKFAEEDKVKRELVDVRNEADQAIYASESSLKEHKDALDEANVTAMEVTKSMFSSALRILA